MRPASTTAISNPAARAKMTAISRRVAPANAETISKDYTRAKRYAFSRRSAPAKQVTIPIRLAWADTFATSRVHDMVDTMDTNDTSDTTMTLRLPDDVHRRIRVAAAKEGKSMAQWIRESLVLVLNRVERTNA